MGLVVLDAIQFNFLLLSRSMYYARDSWEGKGKWDEVRRTFELLNHNDDMKNLLLYRSTEPIKFEFDCEFGFYFILLNSDYRFHFAEKRSYTQGFSFFVGGIDSTNFGINY